MAGYELTENTQLTNYEVGTTGTYGDYLRRYTYKYLEYNFHFFTHSTQTTIYINNNEKDLFKTSGTLLNITTTDIKLNGQYGSNFLTFDIQKISEVEFNLIILQNYGYHKFNTTNLPFSTFILNFTINEDRTLNYNGKINSYLISSSIDSIFLSFFGKSSSSNKTDLTNGCLYNIKNKDETEIEYCFTLSSLASETSNNSYHKFLKVNLSLEKNLFLETNTYDNTTYNMLKVATPSELLNCRTMYQMFDYNTTKNNFKINDDFFFHLHNKTGAKFLITKVNFKDNKVNFYELDNYINFNKTSNNSFFNLSLNDEDNYFYCLIPDENIELKNNESIYHSKTYNAKYYVNKYNYNDLFSDNNIYNVLTFIEKKEFTYNYFSDNSVVDYTKIDVNTTSYSTNNYTFGFPNFYFNFSDENKSFGIFASNRSLLLLNKKYEKVLQIEEYLNFREFDGTSQVYILLNLFFKDLVHNVDFSDLDNVKFTLISVGTWGNYPYNPNTNSSSIKSITFTISGVQEIPDILPDEDPDITLPDDTTEEDGYEVVNFKKYDLFLFNNDTSNNYLTQKIKFSTDQIRSYNGKTQVINLRQNPLMSINVDFTLSKFKKQQFKNFLTYNFEKPFLFPMFNNKIKHTSIINNDENSVEVFFDNDFVDFEFFNNDAVLFYKNEKEYFLRNIKYVKQNSIILQDYIPKTALAGYFDVIPLKLVKIDKAQNITLTNLNQNILQATLSLKYVINDKDVIKNTYTNLIFNEETGTYDPNEVFVDFNEENFSKYNNKFFIDDKLIDFDSKQTRTIIKDVEVFKNENYGIEEEFLVNDFNFDEIDNIKFYLNSRNKIIDFKRFLQSLNGNQKSFYLPSFEEECEVVKLMTNNIIAIKRNDFDKILEKNDSNHIVIYNKKGEKMITEILSYQQKYNANLSLQVTELTLKDDIVNHIESDIKKIDRINYLNEVVFSDNETTFDFEKDDFCVIIKKVKRIKNVD